MQAGVYYVQDCVRLSLASPSLASLRHGGNLLKALKLNNRFTKPTFQRVVIANCNAGIPMQEYLFHPGHIHRNVMRNVKAKQGLQAL